MIIKRTDEKNVPGKPEKPRKIKKNRTKIPKKEPSPGCILF